MKRKIKIWKARYHNSKAALTQPTNPTNNSQTSIQTVRHRHNNALFYFYSKEPLQEGTKEQKKEQQTTTEM